MIAPLRRQYNQLFRPENYSAYLQELGSLYTSGLDFRLAETPVFVPRDFTRKMQQTCEAVIDAVLQPGYLQKSERAIPPALRVPNESPHPDFMVFDFAVSRDEAGKPEPKLIEMQGFPSIFAWHALVPEIAKKHFWLPQGFSPYLNGLERDSYLDLLKKTILGRFRSENVVLLEIFPHAQKTRVDFYATWQLLGIRPVCLTEVFREGKQLFYDNEGKKTIIHRIYNRVIFDDLQRQAPEVQAKGRIFQAELEVEWAPHPNWFFRLSKFTLPFLQHPQVPPTYFMNEFVPADLQNYVLKPLFSFAGQGVVVDITRADMEKITDPENWILQQKVEYAPLIETPDQPAKAEIRLFYFWPPGAARPIAAGNLARLSKGKMIGVDFNKNQDWVGGSFCLFES